MTATTDLRPPSAVVARGTVAALARAEIRYVLRNPLLWLGLAVYAASAWIPFVDGTPPSTDNAWDDYLLLDWTAGPLALAAFLVANWAALRERPRTTAELFSNTPARRWERTAGLLLAAVVPFALALLVSVVQGLLVLAVGGIRIGEEEWTTLLVPTPLELLGAPLSVASSFVAGVAVARLVRSRAAGAVLGVVSYVLLFLAFWIWLTAPFGVFGVWRPSLVAHDLGTDPGAAELNRWPAVDAPDRLTPPSGEFVPHYFGIERDLGLYGLHLGYVVGVTIALAGLALLRSGRDRRSWPLLGAGLALAAVSASTVFLLHDAARVWMGAM